MASQTRKVDAKSRVILPEQFAGRMVVIQPTNESEVLIRLVRTPRGRPSLQELLARVTPNNLPEKVDFGSPIGQEML